MPSTTLALVVAKMPYDLLMDIISGLMPYMSDQRVYADMDRGQYVVRLDDRYPVVPDALKVYMPDINSSLRYAWHEHRDDLGENLVYFTVEGLPL